MANDCPPIELLAAYIDHNVTPEERATVETHMVECAICRKTVVLTVKSLTIIPDPVLPDPAR